MPSAIKAIFGADATPFVSAMKVVESSAMKAGSQTAASLRQAGREIEKALASATLSVRQSEFYAAALVKVRAELAAVTRAEQERAAAANASAARRAANVLMRPGQAAFQEAQAAGVITEATRMATPGNRAQFKTKGDVFAVEDEKMMQNRAALKQLIEDSKQREIRAAEAAKQAHLAKEAAIGSALEKRKRHLEAVAEYEQRLARKATGAAAFASRQIDDAQFKAKTQQQSRLLMADHAAAKARAASEAAELARANSFRGRMSTFFGGIGSGLAMRFLGVGAAIGAVYKSIRLVGESIQADITMQRIHNTLLAAAGGNARQAAGDFAFLLAASKRIGFSFQANADNFARFSIASTQAGMSAAQTRRVFIGVMEASAVMGLSAERTGASMLALEQMLSKGVVSAQELRLQLGNAMPSAVNTMAKALGLTVPQLFKAVETGSIKSADAVEKFAQQLKRDFNLTPEANKTIRDIERMNTAIFELKAAVGELSRPIVSGGAEGLTDQLNRIQLLIDKADELAGKSTKPEDATKPGPVSNVLKSVALGALFGKTGVTISRALNNPGMDRLLAADKASKKARADATNQETTKTVFRLDAEANALVEVAAKEKQLNDLLLNRIKIMDLLKQKSDLSADAQVLLAGSLLSVNRQIQLNQEGDSQKKLELQAKFAREDLATAKKELQTATAKAAEQVPLVSSMGVDEAQKRESARQVAEQSVKNAAQQVKAANQAVRMTGEAAGWIETRTADPEKQKAYQAALAEYQKNKKLFAEKLGLPLPSEYAENVKAAFDEIFVSTFTKPEKEKKSRGGMNVTDQQRHGAFIAGPAIAMLDVNKSMDRSLKGILSAIKGSQPARVMSRRSNAVHFGGRR